MENISKAPEMFEALSRMELDILLNKMNRAVASCWNRSKRADYQNLSANELGGDVRAIRADLINESDRRIAL